MQNPFNRSDASEFDDAIQACLAEMNTYGLGTEEYKTAYGALQGLTAMREARAKKRVSPDMWVLVGGHVFTAALVGAIEQRGGLMMSKFRDFAPKLRS